MYDETLFFRKYHIFILYLKVEEGNTEHNDTKIELVGKKTEIYPVVVVIVSTNRRRVARARVRKYNVGRRK